MGGLGGHGKLRMYWIDNIMTHHATVNTQHSFIRNQVTDNGAMVQPNTACMRQ